MEHYRQTSKFRHLLLEKCIFSKDVLKAPRKIFKFFELCLQNRHTQYILRDGEVQQTIWTLHGPQKSSFPSLSKFKRGNDVGCRGAGGITVYGLLWCFFLLHCKEIWIYVFQGNALCGLSPNFHIHVSVSDLYIPTFGPSYFPAAE